MRTRVIAANDVRIPEPAPGEIVVVERRIFFFMMTPAAAPEYR